MSKDNTGAWILGTTLALLYLSNSTSNAASDSGSELGGEYDDGEYAIPGVPASGWASYKGPWDFVSINGKLTSVPANWYVMSTDAQNSYLAYVGITRGSGTTTGTPATTGTANMKNIQAALNRWPSSLPRLVVDGIAGLKTVTRLKEFQRQRGLPQTGVADSATVAALNASPPSSNTTPTPSPSPTPTGTGTNNTPTPQAKKDYTPYLVLGGLGLVIAAAAFRD